MGRDGSLRPLLLLSEQPPRVRITLGSERPTTAPTKPTEPTPPPDPYAGESFHVYLGPAPDHEEVGSWWHADGTGYVHLARDADQADRWLAALERGELPA